MFTAIYKISAWKSEMTNAPGRIGQEMDARDMKSTSRHGDVGSWMAKGKDDERRGGLLTPSWPVVARRRPPWAARPVVAHRGLQGGAACLHSTAGTTYPPSVGGRGAALPLNPHYLHDHRLPQEPTKSQGSKLIPRNWSNFDHV